MIPLRNWKVTSPIHVGGMTLDYSDTSTTTAEIDPKAHRMGVRMRDPEGNKTRKNPTVWVPLANVACYVTEEDAQAEDDRVARLLSGAPSLEAVA